MNRKKTPHKLWIDFTRKALDEWLVEGGRLYQVSPSSFMSPRSKALAMFRKHQVDMVDLRAGRWFPQVGSSFASYIVQAGREALVMDTHFITETGQDFSVTLDENALYLPNDLCAASFNIHQKVMFQPAKKMDVRFDYVTFHNSVLKRPDSPLSRSQTLEHVFPVFHTNSQTWWSSRQQEVATQMKVLWSRSGYTKPFYDDGQLGLTDMAYYVPVESAEQGMMLEHNLNTKLFQYVFATARWSGFGEAAVFHALPQLPMDVALAEEQMYDLFHLSATERAYVEQFHAKVKSLPPAPTIEPVRGSEEPGKAFWEQVVAEASSHAYMAGVERTVERVKASAEVFTPTGLVVELLSAGTVNVFAPGRRVLDPACGDGQFLMVAKLVKMLWFGMSEEDALADLSGVDIMADNVELAMRRLGGGTILVGNALRPEESVVGQTQQMRAELIRLLT